jgi:hypothetical protein
MDVGLATVEDLAAIVAINNHVAATSIANFATDDSALFDQTGRRTGRHQEQPLPKLPMDATHPVTPPAVRR